MSARWRALEAALTVLAVIAFIYAVAWVQAPWPTALLAIPALAVAVGAGVGAVRLAVSNMTEEEDTGV